MSHTCMSNHNHTGSVSHCESKGGFLILRTVHSLGWVILGCGRLPCALQGLQQRAFPLPKTSQAECLQTLPDLPDGQNCRSKAVEMAESPDVTLLNYMVCNLSPFPNLVPLLLGVTFPDCTTF